MAWRHVSKTLSYLAVILSAKALSFPEEDSVVVLDPTNFDEFIKSQEFTIVGELQFFP